MKGLVWDGITSQDFRPLSSVWHYLVEKCFSSSRLIRAKHFCYANCCKDSIILLTCVFSLDLVFVELENN